MPVCVNLVKELSSTILPQFPPVLYCKSSLCHILQEQSEALQVTKHHDLLANVSEELLHLPLPALIQDPRQVIPANKKTQ